MSIIASTTPQATVDNRADLYAVFTKAEGTSLLVSVPQWTKLTLRLETAGPVAVGTREQLDPVGSGKGRLLPTNEDVVVIIGPNTRFFYASTGFHRISVHIEAIPWLQSIFEAIKGLAKIVSTPSKPASSPPPTKRNC